MIEDVPIKAYTIGQLKDFYEISYAVIHRWFDDEKEVIGELIGRTYNIKQVQIIFKIFGTPKIKTRIRE